MSQKNWDKYEVALLIEVYQNIKHGRVDKNSALVALSQNLRKIAQNENLEIDDTFRNMNGMQWQLGFIERAFIGDDYDSRTPPKIFMEMVGIYNQNQKEFLDILEEAHRKINGDTNMGDDERKKLFIKWLGENISFSPMAVVNNINYVSAYAFKRSIAKKSFWSFSDYKEFNTIRVRLSGNKIFKLMHGKEHRQFEKSGKLYSDFLKANFDIHVDTAEGSSSEEDAKKESICNTFASAEDRRVCIISEEKEAITNFFDGDIDTANTFIELLKYQKRVCPSIILDIRATIIGAKIEGERLRFYVDKQRRIVFSKLKINDKRYVKSFTDSLLPDFFDAVDESNKYFAEHPDDVELNGYTEIDKQDNSVSYELCGELSKVLEDFFNNGFKLGNVLNRRRFYNKYEELFGKPLSLEATEFDKLLYQIGFKYENLIYPSTILTADNKQLIISYIITALNAGTKVIYYSALYENFKEVLLGHIYDYHMLKSYLQYINCQDFYCGDEYISIDKNIQVDLKKELIELFLNVGTPLTYDEIYAKFPNIEKEQINSVLRDKDFIVNYKGKSYFYKEIFVCTEAEMASIKNFLYKRIIDVGASSGTELYAYICENLPEMCNVNPWLTDLGFRGALRLQLEDEFDFRGDIISLDGQKIDVSDLYRKFCLERESFSFEELEEFKTKTNGNIYFDVVFNHAIRINETQYIRRDKIHFDVDRIDDVLEKFFNGDYLPFENVIFYTNFPTMDYPWNEYLLESYVYSFSNKFVLFHKSFNQSFPTGAIVRKESAIKTWEDLLIKVLRDNKINGDIMTANEAFDFLREHRYITVRRAKDIELIIAKAKR